ncbi:MAG TPA: hypothetical protein VF591_06380, partial [Pyrinomonadaceae bacterium]
MPGWKTVPQPGEMSLHAGRINLQAGGTTPPGRNEFAAGRKQFARLQTHSARPQTGSVSLASSHRKPQNGRKSLNYFSGQPSATPGARASLPAKACESTLSSEAADLN